jgi:anti-sigma factor RsiW
LPGGVIRGKARSTRPERKMAMDCKRLLEDLNLYIDGELEQDLCRQLEQHLKGCDRCRIVLDTTRKTINLFCENQLMDLPSEVSDRLHQVLRARFQKPV